MSNDLSVKCLSIFDMAHKRMFSKDITTSDAFREMPQSSQALYFHLGMEADDDGFLDNYKGLMRAINASDDDLRVLLGKRFLILFPSKVVVVKHWLINNTVRSDRYKETKHLEEKRALVVKENGSYTELSSGIPNGNQMATQYRIEEDRKDTARAEDSATDSLRTEEVRIVDVGEDTERKVKDPATKQYDTLCKWAEDRRGFKFVNRLKQYAALKKARATNLSISKLKDRWIECEGESWRDGFDWTSVVSSFDKKA